MDVAVLATQWAVAPGVIINSVAILDKPEKQRVVDEWLTVGINISVF